MACMRIFSSIFLAFFFVIAAFFSAYMTAGVSKQEYIQNLSFLSLFIFIGGVTFITYTLYKINLYPALIEHIKESDQKIIVLLFYSVLFLIEVSILYDFIYYKFLT